MGSGDNAFVEGERVILHRHPHFRRLILPVLVLLSATAAACFLAAVCHDQPWELPLRRVAVGAIAVGWLAVVATRSVAPFLRWVSTDFVLTDRRIILSSGVVTRTRVDIPLGRITALDYQRGLLERLTGSGTLLVDTMTREPLAVPDVPRVSYIYELLCREVFGLVD